MQMYNLIDYSDNYSKSFGRLWHYYRHEPKITDRTGNDSTKMLKLEYH